MTFFRRRTVRRGRDRALFEFTEGFRVAFEHAPIGRALIGVDDRFRQVNTAFCEITGYSAEQLLARKFTDVTHPDDIAEDVAAMARLLTDEQPSSNLEKRYLTPTGDVVWAEKSVTLVRQDDGAPSYFIAQVQNITARKENELRLANEGRRLRDAESIGRTGAWERDVATGAVTWSEGVFELYGIDPATFDGDYETAMECVHPDDRARVAAAADSLTAGGTGKVRYRIRRLDDGAVRWIDARGRAIFQGAELVRIAGAIADVTDQVLAEVEVAAGQSFEQAVLTASPDIIAVWNFTSGSSTWMNRSIGELLGYTSVEIADMATDVVGRLVHVDDQEGYRASMVAAHDAEDDRVRTLTYRMMHRDGTVRWFLRRTAPLCRDEHGRVVEIVGIIRDTTEEMAVEAALADSQTLFNQLADTVDVAFLVRSWNPARFLYVSPAYARIFGYDPLAVDESPEDVLLRIHPDDLARFKQNYWQPSREGQPARFEYRIIRPDGEVRWIRCSAVPVVQPHWIGQRTASFIEDVTVSRRAEIAIRSATEAANTNAARSQFLSRMSHELRTPLNAILGFAQLLDLDELNEDQQSAVEHILSAGRHQVDLIDDLLDIAKFESDRLEMSLETISIPGLLHETIQVMQSFADASGVRLEYDHTDWPYRPIYADSPRVRQVVFNLMSNAIKFNRRGGSVYINYHLRDDSVAEIIVTDTGRGIGTEDIPRLFTPFDRLDADSTSVPGRGVGLALSYRLMTAMGGTLTATSKVGVGCTFTATFELVPVGA